MVWHHFSRLLGPIVDFVENLSWSIKNKMDLTQKKQFATCLLKYYAVFQFSSLISIAASVRMCSICTFQVQSWAIRGDGFGLPDLRMVLFELLWPFCTFLFHVLMIRHDARSTWSKKNTQLDLDVY